MKKEIEISAKTREEAIEKAYAQAANVTFEKHKIFLYREDFAKFANSLNEAINFVIAEQGEYKSPYAEQPGADNGEEKLNIDIEF